MKEIEALKSQPLFSWISNAPLEYLVKSAETRSLKPGETIYEKDSAGNSIYLILDGTILFESGSTKQTTLTKGQLFGECSVIEVKARTCTATAKEASSLFILSHEVLYQFSQEYPDPYSIVVTNLARCLAARIRDLNEQKATSNSTEKEQ